jgi:hypothetical protein
MARSTAKVILFSRLTVDGKVHQWPTAVFNDHNGAKSYATMIKMAHTSGDVKSAQSLDKHTAVDDKGKLIAGLKFSIAEVPYDPSPALGDGDLFGDDETQTS